MAVGWDKIIQSESQWIQCTKCGDVPRGNPAMFCTGCKASHGEWRPNMMGLIIGARQQYSQSKGLLMKQAAETQKLSDMVRLAQKRTAELERTRDSANSRKTSAIRDREAAQGRAAAKGPETVAAIQRQSAGMFDDLERLVADQASARASADAAEARAAALEAEVAALQESVDALDAEVVPMRGEAGRLKDIVIDVMARKKAPAAAAPNGVAADVWAHILRAQGNAAAASPLAHAPPPFSAPAAAPAYRYVPAAPAAPAAYPVPVPVPVPYASPYAVPQAPIPFAVPAAQPHQAAAAQQQPYHFHFHAPGGAGGAPAPAPPAAAPAYSYPPPGAIPAPGGYFLPA